MLLLKIITIYIYIFIYIILFLVNNFGKEYIIFRFFFVSIIYLLQEIKIQKKIHLLFLLLACWACWLAGLPSWPACQACWACPVCALITDGKFSTT